MLAIFLFVTFGFTQTSSPHTLSPVDEAASEPSLVAARKAVVRALQKHDLAATLAAIDDAVVIAMAGGGTKSTLSATLQSEWFPTGTPPARLLSDELLHALTLGGSFTVIRGSQVGERQFCAPFVYSAYPNWSVEGTPPSVLLSADAAIRAQPDVTSSILARLNREFVTVGGSTTADAFNREWRLVTTGGGVTGYVPADSVRNPTEYHVCFGLRGAAWLVTEIGQRVPLPQ